MYEDLIEQHLKLVIQENKTTNITRISSYEEGILLHVEDSLTGLPEINAAPNGLYADLGTGGGFPGIPLAIKTGRTTVLVDSVKKKAAILDRMIATLGLENQISSYDDRIENLARERKNEFAVVTARALAKLSVLMELASPLLLPHGRLICYKSHIEEDELSHALSLQEKTGMTLVSDRSFTLSDDATFRRIVCFEKTAKARIVLPRNVGMAQKRPL